MRKGLSCCLIRPGLPLGHTDLCHTLGLAKENNYGLEPPKRIREGGILDMALSILHSHRGPGLRGLQ